MAARIPAHNGVSQYLFSQALRDMLEKTNGQQGQGEQGQQVGVPNRSVQLAPSAVAPSNILTAIPHLIGRGLGATDIGGGQVDPRTGAYTPQVLLHPTIDALLNGGAAGNSVRVANQIKSGETFDDLLNRGDASFSQGLDQATTGGHSFSDPRGNPLQPTTATIGDSGIIATKNAANRLGLATLEGKVINDPNLVPAMQAGAIATAKAPSIPEPMSVGAGGAGVIPNPMGGAPTILTGGSVVPTENRTSVSTTPGIGTNGMPVQGKTIDIQSSSGTQGTVSQPLPTLTADQQKAVMQAEPSQNPNPDAIPTPSGNVQLLGTPPDPMSSQVTAAAPNVNVTPTGLVDPNSIGPSALRSFLKYLNSTNMPASSGQF